MARTVSDKAILALQERVRAHVRWLDTIGKEGDRKKAVKIVWECEIALGKTHDNLSRKASARDYVGECLRGGW